VIFLSVGALATPNSSSFVSLFSPEYTVTSIHLSMALQSFVRVLTAFDVNTSLKSVRGMSTSPEKEMKRLQGDIFRRYDFKTNNLNRSYVVSLERAYNYVALMTLS
jgi:hypothetical protein